MFAEAHDYSGSAVPAHQWTFLYLGAGDIVKSSQRAIGHQELHGASMEGKSIYRSTLGAFVPSTGFPLYPAHMGSA